MIELLYLIFIQTCDPDLRKPRFMGVTSALVFANLGAAYGTAKSGTLASKERERASSPWQVLALRPWAFLARSFPASALSEEASRLR